MRFLTRAKKLLKSPVLLLALLMLTGCATSGATYSEMHASQPKLADGMGRIYFYREASMMGSAIQPSVTLNGEKVGESVPGGFFYIDRPAGDYKIVTSTEVDRSLSLTLAPGQTRYVRFSISMGFMAGHVSPELVEDATGAKEIQDCHYTGGDTSKTAKN